MPDNRPNNRPLDPNDDLLTDDSDPIPYELTEEPADASAEDGLAEQTDNSGEALAEADDVPQDADAVVLEDDEADADEAPVEAAPDGE